MSDPVNYKTPKDSLTLQLDGSLTATEAFTTVNAVNNLNLAIGEALEKWKTVVSELSNNRVVGIDPTLAVVMKLVKGTPLTTKLKKRQFKTMQDRIFKCRILDTIADETIVFDANIESLVFTNDTAKTVEAAFTVSVGDASSFAVIPSDTVAPTISVLDPVDGAAAVAVDATLAITFDRNVVFGSGNVMIFDADTNLQLEAINVTSGDIVISGATATITHANYPAASNIYIFIQAGAFKNTGGVDFAGILNNTTWNFATA